MPVVLNYAARSDVGRVRSKNDDSAYVGRHLAVVADGMGGHVGGDVASASTVLDLAPLDHTGHSDPTTVLADEIQNANLILNDLVNTNPKLAGMGTTCTALLLEGSTLHMAHIGDSRAYRLKDDAFEQISTDHTFVQRLVDEGRLDPADAETHPHKNVLMRVLGDVDASPELDLATFEVADSERWLLCSDGLNAVVPDQVIEQKLRHGTDPKSIADELVDLTLAGGSPDNVTVVVFEVAAVPAATGEGAPAEMSETARAAATASASAESDESQSVSAALLREDLGSRPHLLVGAAQLATDTDQIPIVTRLSTAKRAANLLHGAEEGDQLSYPDSPQLVPAGLIAGSGAESASTPTATRSAVHGASAGAASTTGAGPDGRADSAGSDEPERRRLLAWPLITVAGVLAVLFGAGLVFSYLWTQSQYYVGSDGENVAIYQGVSQSLGPINLSDMQESSDIPLDRLPAYSRQRVESGLPAQDEQHARDIIADLQENLTPEAPPVTTPDPTGSASPSVSGSSAQASIGGAAAGAMGGNS